MSNSGNTPSIMKSDITALLSKDLHQIQDEISDVLETIVLNLTSLKAEGLQQAGAMLDGLASIRNCLTERQSKVAELMIVKQIQQQEAKVRRDRLHDYEERILQLRRLVSEKQSFFEALQMPKKRRPANISPAQFKVTRQRQKILEESVFNSKFNDEIITLNRMLKHPYTQVSKPNAHESTISQALSTKDISKNSGSGWLKSTKTQNLDSAVDVAFMLSITKQQLQEKRPLLTEIYHQQKYSKKLNQRLKEQLNTRIFLKEELSKVVQNYKKGLKELEVLRSTNLQSKDQSKEKVQLVREC